MSLVGYARVSTAGQSLDVQLDQLKAAGCEKVFSEKQSAGSTKDRDQLAEALSWVREGDTLVVCRLDRLARSVPDLERVVEALKDKGVNLRLLHPATDINMAKPSAMDRIWLSILGLVAEVENTWRRERQAEGIARAKAEGRYGVRNATISADQVHALADQGLGPAAIARKLNIARSTVYVKLAEPRKDLS